VQAGITKKTSPFCRIGAHADQMTNPKRNRSTFQVIELVVHSTRKGVELRLKDRGTASVPLAENDVKSRKYSPKEG
jgi:hypothetical protein